MKRTVYTADTRKQAVEILASGVGHRTLAAQLGIPVATARQWARSYLAGGSEAVLNAGARHRVYDYDLKLAAARKMLRENKRGVDDNARIIESLIKVRDELKQLKRQLDYLE